MRFRGHGTTGFLLPLGIYFVSRAVTAVFLTLAAAEQPAIPGDPAMRVAEGIPASPGYGGILANWDGQWFKSIALSGYPSQLPAVDGAVAQNEWAYPPIYPFLSRAVMEVTGLPFEVAASTLSLSAGAAAMVVIFRLLSGLTTRFAAGATVACLSTFPSSAVFQVAYTEGLVLLLLALIISSLRSHRYGWVAGLSLVLGLTRLVAAPVAALVVVHSLLRWRDHDDPFPRRERLGAGLASLSGLVAVALWPLAAGATTGRWDALFATHDAWRFRPDTANLSFGAIEQALRLQDGDVTVLVLIEISLIAILLLRPESRAWGSDLRVWLLLYPAYMLATTVQPNMGILRYVLLAIVPLWPFPESGRPGERRATIALRWLMLGVLLSINLSAQYFWVTEVYGIDKLPPIQPFP